jgi:hypothetical protein
MYATLTAEGLRLHDGVPTLEQMQEVVDGYIETAIRVPSSRKGITIDIYCNGEGLLQELPIRYIRAIDNHPLAGNLIAVCGNTDTGESEPMRDSDIGLLLGAVYPVG